MTARSTSKGEFALSGLQSRYKNDKERQMAYWKIHPGLLLGVAALLMVGAGATAADKKADKELPPKPSVGDVLKRSTPADWRPLDPDNTLYLELPAGRVVIELA